MKRRGRPPLDAGDPSVQVTIALPSKHFDAFCALARRHQVSVPEIIRQAMRPRPAKNPKK